jgi:nitrous oxidase accessory protein NosD
MSAASPTLAVLQQFCSGGEGVPVFKSGTGVDVFEAPNIQVGKNNKWAQYNVGEK